MMKGSFSHEKNGAVVSFAVGYMGVILGCVYIGMVVSFRRISGDVVGAGDAAVGVVSRGEVVGSGDAGVGVSGGNKDAIGVRTGEVGMSSIGIGSSTGIGSATGIEPSSFGVTGGVGVIVS